LFITPLGLESEENREKLRWLFSCFFKRKGRDIERLNRGGGHEGEKQRSEGKQEGAAVESQGEEKVEEGEKTGRLTGKNPVPSGGILTIL